MSHYRQLQLQEVAERVAAQKIDRTRHKCFISYHAEDTEEVKQFLEDFGTEFIAKTIGVTDEDDFIDSVDTGYIMDRIRTKYLGDSSVTVVLIGSCTSVRRYVDWEIYSSLRASKHSSVNGLVAIQLPSAAQTGGKLPDRLNDNVSRDKDGRDLGYARYWVYPQTRSQLRGWIDDAFDARTSRAHLLDNSRARRQRNGVCNP
ncbi:MULTISPECIES: TIR domain-containing protein [unclassified Isoptericola]|uniref:TIR domain-containing protein n=1 Tax=unclassified Isoptericola TaxID=2623355 RepID=UPI0027123C32|nr:MULTISPECIES: TIR domain-containing protein [unclassified Isoptericola]MDO8145643.1 TIR domain-containing protein [Isoptericola sp. 178]MDO8152114.1 TIR domain-containing protein [Isoptericola sp. b408]